MTVFNFIEQLDLLEHDSRAGRVMNLCTLALLIPASDMFEASVDSNAPDDSHFGEAKPTIDEPNAAIGAHQCTRSQLLPPGITWDCVPQTKTNRTWSSRSHP